MYEQLKLEVSHYECRNGEADPKLGDGTSVSSSFVIICWRMPEAGLDWETGGTKWQILSKSSSNQISSI